MQDVHDQVDFVGLWIINDLMKLNDVDMVNLCQALHFYVNDITYSTACIINLLHFYLASLDDFHCKELLVLRVSTPLHFTV